MALKSSVIPASTIPHAATTKLSKHGVTPFVPSSIPAPGKDLSNVARKSMVLGPPASLANSPDVNNAYRNLMSGRAQGDVDKGELRRNLTRNLETSHLNRGKSILNSHTNLNENGLLNSGIALKKDTELNTNYDTVDNQMTNNANKGIDDIDRHILDLSQRYQDRQVEASAAETQRRADAAAAKLLVDNQNANQNQQINDLMAALGLAGPASAPAPVDTSYADAANAWAAAVARNNATPVAKPKPKPKPASGSTGSLALKRIGGPQ